VLNRRRKRVILIAAATVVLAASAIAFDAVVPAIAVGAVLAVAGGGVAVVIGVSSIGVQAVGEAVRPDDPPQDTDARASAALLSGAARLLPDAVRSRYQEEWRGELYDLRADSGRWDRISYVTGVLLYAAPALAVTLRLSPTRAVE
jgi:hypothetical protein